MLFLLAAVTGVLSVQDYLDILPAESYEDKGVYTFRPYQVLPVQVENTGTGREKRMNPTKTVYMVYYRDTEAKGYRWEERAVSRESGEKTVDAGGDCGAQGSKHFKFGSLYYRGAGIGCGALYGGPAKKGFAVTGGVGGIYSVLPGGLVRLMVQAEEVNMIRNQLKEQWKVYEARV